MYLFNLNVTSLCQGSRVPVVAAVSNPPVFTSVTPAPGAPRTICGGASVTLNATGGGYSSYTWNPGNLPNNSVVSPTVTTSYTLTASDATCRRDSVVTITVNATPTALTITPASAAVCPSTQVTLTASGGKLLDQTIFSEMFEGSPLAQFTLSGSGVTATQNTTYYQQGSSSVRLSYVNNAVGQMAMTSSVNLTQYQNPKLSFYQICATEDQYDYGFVEWSGDGGTSWNSFTPANYLGSGTLKNGSISFDASSYPDWLAQFSGTGSTPGTGPASSLWKLETINLAPYAAFSNFKVRFKITADFLFVYYGWLIDNVRISGDAQAPVVWTPAGGELFFDAAATMPNDAVTPSLVMYSFPTVGHTYTATAANGAGCSKTATSTISITSAGSPTISISSVGGTTVCAGSAVTFSAVITNGGAYPGFKWLRNGVTQMNPPGGYNQNPGHNPFTYTGPLVNGDVITCELLSSAGCVSPSIVTSNSLVMTVNPKPTISINQTGATCFPSVLTVTDGGGISLYEWFFNSAPVGTNTNTYNASGPGNYMVIATTAGGCKDTSTRILTQATYTLTSSAINGTISPSGALVVNCGANQVYSYTPSPGYAVCDVVINGISRGNLPSPYTFNNVRGDSSINVIFCNTSCAYTYTVFAGNNSSICANATYTLGGNSSVSPSLAGYSSTWSSSTGGTFVGGNVWGTATGYIPSALDISNGSFVLTLTSNNPGGAGCVAAVSTVTIQIIPAPVVTITGLQGVCTGGTTTLTANATIATGTITGYTWTGGVTPFNLASHTYNATGSFSNTVTASNGCSTVTPINIISFTNPSTPTISGGAFICVGGSTNLTANVASAGNAGATIAGNGYQWNTAGPTPIGGAVNQVYNATATGTYSVIVTNSNGCKSAYSAGYPVSYFSGPMSGGYTIGAGPASCTNYVSFATAISDLNTRGVNGNVRFDIPAGYVETVPTGGLALGSGTLNAGSDTVTISFVKNGVGANPLLNAYSGGTGTPSSAIPDGIWSLRGVNNVTIDGIDLFDGNTTGNSTMEYGFGLFKLSGTDGAKGNTIRNSTISLQRSNVGIGGTVMADGSTGIAVMNSLATNANSAITTTSVAGSNSKNKFYSNTIKNVTTGIAIIGFAATTPFAVADSSNDIGGNSLATGNTIIDFGGIAASYTAVAVYVKDQWSLNISNNTINNSVSVPTHPFDLRGIRTVGGNTASVTISNNDIILKCSAVSTRLLTAIDNALGGTTAASNTITISNNKITGTYSTAVSGTFTGISNSGLAATVNMSDNYIHDISLPGNGNWVGIQNNSPAGTLTLNMNNNIVKDCNISSTGTIACIDNNSTVTNNINVSGNTISGMIKATTALVTWLRTINGSSNATVVLFNNNSITNNEVQATSSNLTMSCILLGTGSYTFNNNYIYNNRITGISSGGKAIIFGFSIATATAITENLTNNTVRKLYITGTATSVLHEIYGLNSAGSGATNVKNINGNVVDSLYSAANLSAIVCGIRNTSGNVVNISKNAISNLFPGQSVTTGSYAPGIRIATGTTVNVYNNFINLDLQGNNALTGPDDEGYRSF